MTYVESFILLLRSRTGRSCQQRLRLEQQEQWATARIGLVVQPRGIVALETIPSATSSAYGLRTFFATRMRSPVVLKSKPRSTRLFPTASEETPETPSNSVADEVCTCTWLMPLPVNSDGRPLTAKFGALTDATAPANCEVCSFTRSVVTVVPVAGDETTSARTFTSCPPSKSFTEAKETPDGIAPLRSSLSIANCAPALIEIVTELPMLTPAPAGSSSSMT